MPSFTTVRSFPSPSRAARPIRPLSVTSADRRRSALAFRPRPPGYKTPLHSHPYMETITVLEGEGEAWLEDDNDLVPLKPGVTLVLRPNVRHWFRATGHLPLKTYGIHASPHRIVNAHEER